jgi:transcriptional regulator of nitric oxide reductase
MPWNWNETVRAVAAALLAAWASIVPYRPAQADETAVTPQVLAQVFPTATRVGTVTGTPSAAPVFRGDERVGYLFSTLSVVGSLGFSSKPLDILVGLSNDGRIAGAWLRQHSEPILVIGIPEERLRRYVAGFAGLDVRTTVSETAKGVPDGIAGATISSTIIRDAVLRSARAVAASRRLFGDAPSGVRLDRETIAPAHWDELIADGSIVKMRVTRDRSGWIVVDGSGDPLIELYAGLATPPRVGENLLGQAGYNRLFAKLGADDQAILIAANGLYSFKGTAYVRTGLFERVQIVQGNKTFTLTKASHHSVERLRAGAPEMREIAVFTLPATSGFDPLQPWRLSLLVESETAPPSVVELTYELPTRYRIGTPAAVAGLGATWPSVVDLPLWRQVWQQRIPRVAVLVTLLVALTAVLVFQDGLVRDVRRYRVVRLSFLAITLLWLGWYAGAQLSVVHVLTFVHSLLKDFRWEFFLVDPLIFILWSYVAVTLLFWGRGVFCGWLCPFGALQELINEAARKLKIPQLSVPFAMHERLWPIKYILFIGLFAVSLHSTEIAIVGAEVEPFKTAMTLKFVREWPFVLYAAGLLAAGVFIERFFCRYLCPLGAALAIPARLRMFDWLKRRHQCGRECHICAVRCTVQAIHPSGAINPNECIHCLNCQTLYYDDKTCPPLIQRRQRRQAAKAIGATPAPASPQGGTDE